MNQTERENAIEAILFALGEPVETQRLAQVLSLTQEETEGVCQTLGEKYQARQGGLRLVKLNHSWQMVSAPAYGALIRGMLERRKPDRLSPAALETLAVVAYFQPVTRVYVDQVRGVDSAHSISLLLEREFIDVCGSLDAPGRPNLYRTTPVFLRTFGLSSLEELPPLPPSLTQEEEGGGEP